MLSIECPNCKRGLQAPDESGDHRVVCPGCNVPFAVVLENGAVHTVSTSVSTELPPEKPTPLMEVDEPPEYLPPIVSSVYDDEGARRTRHIHASFKFGFLGSLAFLLYMTLSDHKAPSGWQEFIALLPLILISAALLGGCFTLFVACVLTPKSESRARGDEALRRMWKALDEPPPPPDSVDQPPSADGLPHDPPP
jgi:hypothetical protein